MQSASDRSAVHQVRSLLHVIKVSNPEKEGLLTFIRSS